MRLCGHILEALIEKKDFKKKHDLILFYSKSSNFIFNPVYIPFSESTIQRFNKTDEHGRKYKVNRLADGRVTKTYMKTEGKLAPDYWPFNIVVKFQQLIRKGHRILPNPKA